ncbi:MAG: hypothetical protein R3Y24_09900 [Eubacteriales bacterium]
MTAEKMKKPAQTRTFGADCLRRYFHFLSLFYGVNRKYGCAIWAKQKRLSKFIYL